MEMQYLRYCVKVINKYKRTKLTREDRFKSVFLNKEDYYTLKTSAENMGIPMSSALPMLMHLGLQRYVEVMRIVDTQAKK